MSNVRASEIKTTISKFLSNRLRSIGVDVGNVKHSYFTSEGYNYYDWTAREKNEGLY